jgi:hypothetical protein
MQARIPWLRRELPGYHSPGNATPGQEERSMPDNPELEASGTPSEEFHYHLELTPAQLKITHTALKSLLDDFGHEEHDVIQVIHEVLDKLPDEHSIRAISLERELRRSED